jgi:hypothetical protein
MHSVRLLVAIALCLTVTLAQAAGFRFIDAPAVADGPPSRERCGIPAGYRNKWNTRVSSLAGSSFKSP